MATIIGRAKEIDELNRLYESDKAELIAVYGHLSQQKKGRRRGR